jgi:tetratricopeptide (TPR) repeat protein
MDELERAAQLFYRGLERQREGDWSGAETLYREALLLAPQRVSVLVNLAAVLVGQRRFAEALSFSERALKIEPDTADALQTAALCRLELFGDDQALAVTERVLRVDPDNFAAQSNRGVALRDHGRFEEALASFERALALRPDVAGIRCNRAAMLAQLGRAREALAEYLALLRAQPDLRIAQRGLYEVFTDAAAVEAAIDAEAEAWLVRAALEPWGPPQALAPLMIAVLRRRPEIARLCDDADAALDAALDTLPHDPLLPVLLERCLVTDAVLEPVLARLRVELLHGAAREAHARKASPRLELHCALASQAFRAGYLDVPDSDARAQLARLRQRLQDDASPSASWIAACASYAPLDADPQAELLLARAWPEPVQRLLRQQWREPAEERRLAATVSRLTALAAEAPELHDGDLAHAYPRWTALPDPGDTQSLATCLSLRLPGVDPARLPHGRRIAALDAGCGTGQQAIEFALGVRDIEVLAIDRSRARLAYAKRMAQPLGLGNLRFAQADLLAIGAGLRFDLILCSGLLHHLGDADQGLARLAGHLRGGGVMRLGLLSARGRRHLDAARDFVEARGSVDTSDGVRACRHEILRQSPLSPLRGATRYEAFYSLEGCRELLFHGREHRYDPAAIAAALADEGLEFLGFELDAATRHAFRRLFPDPARLGDLEAWDLFELRFPDAFARGFQAWVRKPTE